MFKTDPEFMPTATVQDNASAQAAEPHKHRLNRARAGYTALGVLGIFVGCAALVLGPGLASSPSLTKLIHFADQRSQAYTAVYNGDSAVKCGDQVFAAGQFPAANPQDEASRNAWAALLKGDCMKLPQGPI